MAESRSISTQKTQRRVGVRKRTATCWELRRWDAVKKGYVSLGYYKSQQEAEAAKADQAAPKMPRAKHTKGTAPFVPFAPFPRTTLTILLCALHFSGPSSPSPGLNTILTANSTFNPSECSDPALIDLARAAFDEQKERAIARLKRHKIFFDSESPPPVDVHSSSGSAQPPPKPRPPAPRMTLMGRSGVILPMRRALARSRCMRRGLRERAARALRFSGGLPMACQLYTILHLVCAMYIARGWRPIPPQHL